MSGTTTIACPAGFFQNDSVTPAVVDDLQSAVTGANAAIVAADAASAAATASDAAAAASATAANASANAAASSASAAATSAASAASSATSATSASTSATASANSASASAIAAAASATTASAAVPSATAAANSATNAATSATNAAASATAAANSAATSAGTNRVLKTGDTMNLTSPLNVNATQLPNALNITAALSGSNDDILLYPAINITYTITGAPNSCGGPISGNLYLHNTHGSGVDQSGVGQPSPSQYAFFSGNVFKMPSAGGYTVSLKGPQSWVYYGTQNASGNPSDSAYEEPTIFAEWDGWYNGTDSANARQAGIMITGHASLGINVTFTGSISGTTLTVPQGTGIGPGHVLSGSGVTAGTLVETFIATSGGYDTWAVSAPQTVASTSMTASAHAAEIAYGGFSWEFDSYIYAVTEMVTNNYTVACIEGRGSPVPQTTTTNGSPLAAGATSIPVADVMIFQRSTTFYNGVVWPDTSSSAPCYADVYAPSGGLLLGSVTITAAPRPPAGSVAGTLTCSATSFAIPAGATIAPQAFYMWLRGGSRIALESTGASFFGYDTTRSTIAFSTSVQFDGGVSFNDLSRFYWSPLHYSRHNPYSNGWEYIVTVSGTDTQMFLIDDLGNVSIPQGPLGVAKGIGAWGVTPPSSQPTYSLVTSTITDANAKAAINALIAIINATGDAHITTS